jgi:hypothetical protein
MDPREGGEVGAKVSTIFWHETDGGARGELGIDEAGRLYWNGQLVVTEQRVRLGWWVNVSVIVGAVATVAIAIFTAIAALEL